MCLSFVFFFFHDPATTEIYTLSLHDALPICFQSLALLRVISINGVLPVAFFSQVAVTCNTRSEERFSRNAETDLVCRLLLEKKKTDHEEKPRSALNTEEVWRLYTVRAMRCTG